MRASSGRPRSPSARARSSLRERCCTVARVSAPAPRSSMRLSGLVWAGQTISIIGSGMTAFALGVWVYQQTGSVTAFTMVTVATYLPGIVLAPFAGVLVDRWDRRRTMILSDILAALTSVAIILLY